MSRIDEQYYSYAEIACRCGCGFSAVEQDVLAWASAMRSYLGYPLHCSSCCRCPDHNQAIDPPGGNRSQHLPRMADMAVVFYDHKELTLPGLAVMASHAMDLHIKREDIARSVEFTAQNFPDISLGIYAWGLHGDSRTIQGKHIARWGATRVGSEFIA